MRVIIQQQEVKFEQCIPQLLKDPYISVNEQNNVKCFSLNFLIREQTLSSFLFLQKGETALMLALSTTPIRLDVIELLCQQEDINLSLTNKVNSFSWLVFFLPNFPLKTNNRVRKRHWIS
jgi:hypothetical protein